MANSLLDYLNPRIVGPANRKDLQSEIARNLDFAKADPKNFGTGATPSDLAGLNEDVSADDEAQAADEKRFSDYQALSDFLSPDQTERRNTEQANKMALATGPADVAAKGNLAVEEAKSKGALDLSKQQNEQTRALLTDVNGEADTGGDNIGGPGTFKPAINATGGVSLTQNVLPALVVRARDQLTDARNKTLEALSEAERMYPGINDESGGADAGKSAGWMDFLTGGGQKYGSAADMAGAANERLKYTMGLPTPFANLAQSASFGNIEQMAGQLPGVRGLATITPLFKEHQSRWGHETPLATVQRLRHMAAIMDDTLNTINGTSEGGQ